MDAKVKKSLKRLPKGSRLKVEGKVNVRPKVKVKVKVKAKTKVEVG
jgi:hypothetical protein